jgi:hypothetical protein
MPVMVRGYLPEKVWRVLAELSHFFRTLYAKQICPLVIEKLQVQVPELLCNLEMIFPPGFFTPMAHLIVHLANEALLGGLGVASGPTKQFSAPSSFRMPSLAALRRSLSVNLEWLHLLTAGASESTDVAALLAIFEAPMAEELLFPMEAVQEWRYLRKGSLSAQQW